MKPFHRSHIIEKGLHAVGCRRLRQPTKARPLPRFPWRSAYFIPFLFFCFLPAAFGASFHPFKNWRTLKTPHFAVHTHESTEAVAAKAAGYLEAAYAKLSPKYDWKPWGRTQVVLTDSTDLANGLASTLPYNWMLLHIAPPVPESTLAFYDDWLKTLIFHEYTHVLHLDAYRGIWKPFRWFLFGKIVAPAGLVPNWVKEGTATMEESEIGGFGRLNASYADMLVRTAVLNRQFPTIDRADGVHWKWPSNKIPYVFGVRFLDYLGRTHGEEKLMEFHRRTQGSLLLSAVNGHARRLFGKSFNKLWKEWQEELRKEYARWETREEEKGFTFLTPRVEGKESFFLPTYSPDGRHLAYVAIDPKKPIRIVLAPADGGIGRKIAERSPTAMTFSPDGDTLVFAAQRRHRRYYLYSDLFEIDLRGKKPKIRSLTRGERARDPDFSPDGKKIVFVAGEKGSDSLKIYDTATKKISFLLKSALPGTQMAHPKFSPDGGQIAFIRFLPGEGWNLCLARNDGTFLRCITRDPQTVEMRPVWTPDGRHLLFVSDADGVFNLYTHRLKGSKTFRLTRVKTGLFQPALSPDGRTLLARYYHGEGYDIRRVPFDLMGAGNNPSLPSPYTKGREKHNPPLVSSGGSSPLYSRKYTPFTGSLFLPRYAAPGLLVLDNGLLLTAMTGSYDPLRTHSWNGGISYRTDAAFLGYFGNYVYNRFTPLFGVGIDDFAVDYGNLTIVDNTLGTRNSYHFFEERRRLSFFASFPIGMKQGIGFSFFNEKRNAVTNLRGNDASALNLGLFNGFGATYVFGQNEAYPASISPIEEGRKLRLSGSVTDAVFGSSANNEQRIFTGDYREYVPLGNNHVLALRLTGGIAFGDRVIPGTFSLGGALGEGVMASGGSSRYFPLRGLPVSTLIADRALLMSAEWRLPLVAPQRGLGTFPLFLNNLHLGLFADYGDAWDGNDATSRESFSDVFDDFFLGTGLELRGDFVIGHGLPVTGRVGYAVIVLNRDRLGNLKDPLIGNAVKNGIFIIQWGTSF